MCHLHVAGGHWAKACEVFDHMVANGCRPDSTTYSAVISALTKGGSWARAVRTFEDMQVQGCRPDAVVYNALLDVLWQSGVATAQAKAVQLWRRAVQRGIIWCAFQAICALFTRFQIFGVPHVVYWATVVRERVW